MRNLVFGSLAMLCVFLMACTEDDYHVSENSYQEMIPKELESTDVLKDNMDFSKQLRAYDLPTCSSVLNIPVFIALANSGANLQRDAAQAALVQWNNLVGSAVNFYEVTSPTSTGVNIINEFDQYNIDTYSDLLPQCLEDNSDPWASQFPRGDGLVGHYIFYAGLSGNTSFNVMKGIVFHELGHILGFHHTDLEPTNLAHSTIYLDCACL